MRTRKLRAVSMAKSGASTGTTILNKESGLNLSDLPNSELLEDTLFTERVRMIGDTLDGDTGEYFQSAFRIHMKDEEEEGRIDDLERLKSTCVMRNKNLTYRNLTQIILKRRKMQAEVRQSSGRKFFRDRMLPLESKIENLKGEIIKEAKAIILSRKNFL